jgi:hypothetical protein
MRPVRFFDTLSSGVKDVPEMLSENISPLENRFVYLYSMLVP